MKNSVATQLYHDIKRIKKKARNNIFRDYLNERIEKFLNHTNNHIDIFLSSLKIVLAKYPTNIQFLSKSMGVTTYESTCYFLCLSKNIIYRFRKDNIQ